ncbi:MAG: ATP-dependent DNA helicase UvrD2 [Thermoleophilia bacterium]|nr:ATP-dependent DNA helicase UvrD2 [Thermoleophilia bacterium]
MDPESILARLNSEQRLAAEALRGPVCILAGAGSGKTTTITHRIAAQVAAGTFPPGRILAVTFTDKAAGEMRARLAGLGVTGVPARTFHSAALAQLTALASEPPGQVLPSKVLLLRQIANGLPRPFRYRAAADLATEIEWAKNRRLTPATYVDGLGEHAPPVPPDVMLRVFRDYERRKAALAKVDFEDLLELAIRMYDADAGTRERFRDRYRAFTVDEYQDVNLLQQTLLERWLGERDDVCVVGDDYQSIYGFTGATPDYLLSFRRRFPGAAVVTLEANYRSSPEVLAFANRLVPRLGGAEKALRAVRPRGPEPVVRSFGSALEEATFVAETAKALHKRDGVSLEEIAVLYRTNARSEDFEEALVLADVPFQVRGGRFLERPAARRLLRVLSDAVTNAVAAAVTEAARAEGWVELVPDGLGEVEETRQQDLARLVALAREFDDGERTVADFLADLRARFGDGEGGRGVHLLTYHRAKGLEFEAVFLPRLEEKELPCRQAKTPAAVDEERRLLYVGITRAKRRLYVSHADGKPSRFLAELGVAPPRRPARPPEPAAAPDDPLFAALRTWRLVRAREDGVPPYVVFHDRTLAEIARRRPQRVTDLAGVPGVGPAKLDRYGTEVIRVLERTP